MNDNKKYEKGITLLALVVTIIILLILAGVSLNALIGENGIIKRSKDSTQKYKNAEQNEQELLKQTENWIDDNYSGGSGNKEYTDSNGDKAVIPDGFAVSKEPGEDKIEDGLVIKDGDGNEWVWVPVADPSTMFDTANNSGQLYDFSGNTYTKKTYLSLGHREPGYLTDSAYADASSYNTVGITQSSLQTEFNQMKASVEKYKGFYCRQI